MHLYLTKEASAACLPLPDLEGREQNQLSIKKVVLMQGYSVPFGLEVECFYSFVTILHNVDYVFCFFCGLSETVLIFTLTIAQMILKRIQCQNL